MSPRRTSSTDVNGEAEQPDDTTVEGVCVCVCVCLCFELKYLSEFLKTASPEKKN